MYIHKYKSSTHLARLLKICCIKWVKHTSISILALYNSDIVSQAQNNDKALTYYIKCRNNIVKILKNICN